MGQAAGLLPFSHALTPLCSCIQKPSGVLKGRLAKAPNWRLVQAIKLAVCSAIIPFLDMDASQSSFLSAALQSSRLNLPWEHIMLEKRPCGDMPCLQRNRQAGSQEVGSCTWLCMSAVQSTHLQSAVSSPVDSQHA